MLNMGKTVTCQYSAILDQNIKVTKCTSQGHDRSYLLRSYLGTYDLGRTQVICTQVICTRHTILRNDWGKGLISSVWGTPYSASIRPSWTKMSKQQNVHHQVMTSHVHACMCQNPPNTVLSNDCGKGSICYVWESCNFPLVGNLGPRFQSEPMYINGP